MVVRVRELEFAAHWKSCHRLPKYVRVVVVVIVGEEVRAGDDRSVVGNHRIVD